MGYSLLIQAKNVRDLWAELKPVRGLLLDNLRVLRLRMQLNELRFAHSWSDQSRYSLSLQIEGFHIVNALVELRDHAVKIVDRRSCRFVPI
jgi:hypothetical protein